MSSEERNCRILSAVRKIFALKGLEGTTTRELAKEAGVSEALLYKHYPSKEALYQAMLGTCDGEFASELKKIEALEPSTSTLVTLVHFSVASYLNHRVPDLELRIRLYLQSILGDGEFARVMIKQKQESCSVNSKIRDSIKAATAAGDLAESPVSADLRALLVGRMSAVIVSDHLPEKPAIDYGESREKLIEHTVWFLLRGLGMKDEAIRQHYNPKALALIAA